MRSIYLLVALLSLSNGFPVSPSGDYITAPEDNGFPVSQSNGYLVASGDESHAAGWQLGEGGRNFDGRYSPLSPEERAREGRLRRQKQLELDDQRRLNKQQEEEARNSMDTSPSITQDGAVLCLIKWANMHIYRRRNH